MSNIFDNLDKLEIGDYFSINYLEIHTNYQVIAIKTVLPDDTENQKIEEMCECEHCHCEEGILKSALKHTLNIIIFIFLITLVINIIIELIGEQTISNFISNNVVLGPIVAGLIGLIPNCASSVILTELFIENVISMPMLISGVAVNAGIGLVVLFKTNKNLKENLSILGLLYVIGVISGIVLQVIL